MSANPLIPSSAGVIIKGEQDQRDRRLIHLKLQSEAMPAVREAQQMQQDFFNTIYRGIPVDGAGNRKGRFPQMAATSERIIKMAVKLLIYLIAGLGAGVGTGLAGLSAAAVISPMLITFLNVPAYEAVAIALASDVLASAISAYTYGKHKNLDIKNGLIMLCSVLIFTLVGSYIASLVPNSTMGGFSVFMTTLLGVKFIVRPVMTTKAALSAKSTGRKAVESIFCGVLIGFICGFIGAGGRP